jgi:prepilin-type processing-associated H-X9-DG protein
MKARTASTLIELIVVVMMVMILCGLLIAAIQKVRAALDRTRCQANLRQIALASAMYHDANNALPPGSSGVRDKLRDASWLARLLPYLEQNAMWEDLTAAYEVSSTPIDSAIHRGFRQPMPLFSCPSDPRLTVAWQLPSYPVPANPVAMTSYLGNLGIDVTDRAGVLFRGSRVNFLQVSDGLGQTVLAGERPPSADMYYGWWYYGTGQVHGSLDYLLGSREVNRSQFAPYRACPSRSRYQNGNIENLCSAFHYWSRHIDGANFAFCDGSVRFVTYDSSSLLPSFSTRSANDSFVPP